MRTEFSPEQLSDPDTAQAESAIRTCVHCGFCTATCPSYLVLGDELDSPRGRIYLMKNMLEQGRPADAKTVQHLDRCLSCLACTTTCPSGVDYMHLIDHAREYVERTYRRPWFDRLLRHVLVSLLPYPKRFRLAAALGRLARPFAGVLSGRLAAVVGMAPDRVYPPTTMDMPQSFPAVGERRRRVGLLTGCVQPALAPNINFATVRLLQRLGCEVVIAPGIGCCGALAHHMGKRELAHDAAAANIRAWIREMDGVGLDAVVINASGCGTTVKDYGHMFRDDPELAESAARISTAASDVTELVHDIGLSDAQQADALRVAYHSACSLQHGQQVRDIPPALLRRAGFEVMEPNEAHICCGSAGTYSLLQPQISRQLQERKVTNLSVCEPDVIATGNIGCLMQIGKASSVPVVHTVELLDWATGGPKPEILATLNR